MKTQIPASAMQDNGMSRRKFAAVLAGLGFGGGYAFFGTKATNQFAPGLLSMRLEDTSEPVPSDSEQRAELIRRRREIMELSQPISLGAGLTLGGGTGVAAYRIFSMAGDAVTRAEIMKSIMDDLVEMSATRRIESKLNDDNGDPLIAEDLVDILVDQFPAKKLARIFEELRPKLKESLSMALSGFSSQGSADIVRKICSNAEVFKLDEADLEPARAYIE